jgi:hypothetical protein
LRIGKLESGVTAVEKIAAHVIAITAPPRGNAMLTKRIPVFFGRSNGS